MSLASRINFFNRADIEGFSISSTKTTTLRLDFCLPGVVVVAFGLLLYLCRAVFGATRTLFNSYIQANIYSHVHI